MIKELTCAVAAVAALPLPAAAATLDYFLKFDSDIKGESQDSKHKDWIDVLNWSWGVSAASASKPAFQPFGWEQGLDSSFESLFLGVAKGTLYKEAQLDVVRAGKDPTPFFQMIFDDVQITKLSSSADGSAITVEAAMVYGSIKMNYRQQKADGKYGTAISATFDLVKNSKGYAVNFSGDPGALLGLAEAGGTLNFLNPVPEPATWASMAAGLALVAAVVRRRRAGGGGVS